MRTQYSSEIFESTTVQNKIDLTANTTMHLPDMFDLLERKVIWADVTYQNEPQFSNKVANNLSRVSLILRAMTRLKKTTLYRLFDLHIQATGIWVSDQSIAEAIYSEQEAITPFYLDIISSEYL